MGGGALDGAWGGSAGAGVARSAEAPGGGGRGGIGSGARGCAGVAVGAPDGVLCVVADGDGGLGWRGAAPAEARASFDPGQQRGVLRRVLPEDFPGECLASPVAFPSSRLFAGAARSMKRSVAS